MRYCKNKISEVIRNFQLSCRFIRLIDITHDIVTSESQAASSNCKKIAFQVLKLQSTNFADSQRKPKSKHARQFNIGSTNHFDYLLCCRQFLDHRLFRRERNIQFQLNAVKFQCRYNQVFCLSDGFATYSQCIFIDRILHHYTIQTMDFHLHDTLKAFFPDSLITVNCRCREDISFEINISLQSLLNRHRDTLLILLITTLSCHFFCFPTGRCRKGYPFLDSVFVVDKKLDPPVSRRKLICSCHSIPPLQLCSGVYTTFTHKNSIHHI